MRFKNKLKAIQLCALISILASCGPATNRLQAPTQTINSAPTEPIYEENLKATWEEPLENSRGVIYERPRQKIKNAKADIIVGLVKMSGVKMNYDSRDGKLEVNGVARILDDQKNNLAESRFDLSGTHKPDESFVDLNPTRETKSNSAEAPIIRAKALCMDVNEQDQYSCSHVVIDFLIAYKNKIYTQQMEVDKKPAISKKDLEADSGKTPVIQTEENDDDDQTETEVTNVQKVNESPAEVEAKDITTEGVEKSIPGPYQGSTEGADLTKIFADDEANIIPKAPAASGPKSAPKPPVSVESQPSDPSNTSTAPDSDKTTAINKDYKQIKGELRQINQSIGFVDNGRLRNATSLLMRQKSLAVNQMAFFEIKSPENNNFFATFEMAQLIERMGQKMNTIFTRKLYVGSVSFKNGGKISPHLSHQIGIDADIGYPTSIDGVKFPVVAASETVAKASSSSKARVVTKLYQNRYSREKTYELLKFVFSQPDIKIERIFADRAIKADLCRYAIAKGELQGPDKELVQKLFENIDHVQGHGNHFHLRLRCSSEDPACRTKLYVKNKGCP